MKQSYLKAIGVDTWTLRQNMASDLPACYVYTLFHEKTLVGLLLASAGMPDNAVETMLQKMMTALKCRSEGHWFPVQPDCSDLDGLRFVVVLGEEFDLNEFSVPVIQSYSPQQLIAQPKLKAETWENLQAVFSYLGSGSSGIASQSRG